MKNTQIISISNIAWDVSMDNDVAQVLNHYAVPCVDIAPSKYFYTLRDIEEEQVLNVKEYWNQRGIKPIGMQSLLFGMTDLNIFGDHAKRILILQHLSSVCKIGSILGATKLVFGSPKNRDRSHLNDDDTLNVAINFFRELGDIAKHHGVVVCLEPNPKCYQANFMINSIDTAYIVQSVNHAHIRMQLDIGAMYINNESPIEIIRNFASIIHHIHISEPYLTPLNKENMLHLQAAEAIHTYLPHLPMTIEMLTSDTSMSVTQICNSIELVQKIYGLH